jgi:hypothetical protein
MDKIRFRSSSDLAWLAHRTLRGVNTVIPTSLFRRVNDRLLLDFNQLDQMHAVVKMRIFLVAAMLVIAFSSVADLLLMIQLPDLMVQIKLLTAVIMLALWVLTHTPNFTRGQSVAMLTAMTALTLCWLSGSVNHTEDFQRINVLYVLLLALTFFAVLATAWRASLQLLVITGLLLLTALYWLRFESIPLAHLQLSGAALLSFALLAIMAGRLYLSIRRQQFLRTVDLSMNNKKNSAKIGCRRLVAIDPLTGVANRQSLDRLLKQEWQHIRQQRGMISLLLLRVQKQTDLVNMATCLQSLTLSSAACVARFDQHCLAVLWLDPLTQPSKPWLQQFQLSLPAVQGAPLCMNLVRLHLDANCFTDELYRRAVNGLQPVS